MTREDEARVERLELLAGSLLKRLDGLETGAIDRYALPTSDEGFRFVITKMTGGGGKSVDLPSRGDDEMLGVKTQSVHFIRHDRGWYTLCVQKKD